MECLKERLQAELDLVSWLDVARHYAFGRLFCVSEQTDIIEVAVAMAEDRSSELKPWLEQGRLRIVNDKDAQAWTRDQERSFNMLIVRPFVLIQEVKRS